MDLILLHCLLFAFWVTSFQEPETLVAQSSKMNAHLMAVVSVYTNIVHDDCLMQSIHDLCLSVVLLFYCNCYSVITSHLVNSWNCLLPQKCFKFEFYITVLMFYKWCTSCLCIICSTLVIKAQSINFIISHYYMNFCLEEISLWSLVNHISSSLQAEKILIVIVHSVAYIWAAFIQIQTVCCVYWENCMPVHLSEVLPNILTALSWSWTGSIHCFLHWVHFI